MFVIPFLGTFLSLSATQDMAALQETPGVVSVRPVTVFSAPEYVVPLGFEAR